ncbi:MAG: hypothetical protein AAF629_00055 [Chloroflexota bacterium]
MRTLELFFGAILVGAYWWIGGYAISWFLPDPLPFQVTRICAATGIMLFALGAVYEDMGYKFPPPLGCLVFVPPGTMIFAGMVIWAMSLVGLFRTFRR